jgi:hypothetical protein
MKIDGLLIKINSIQIMLYESMKFKENKTIYLFVCFSCTSEGPFIRLISNNGDDSFKDLVGISFHFLSILFICKDLALDSYI